MERSMLCVVNLYRLRDGAEPMFEDTRLSVAARRHSADMYKRDYFDHTTPEGRSPTDRARAAGWDESGSVGENIAYNGIGTAYSLFEQWRDSPGHDANMLNRVANSTGVGVWPTANFGFGGIMGTQTFANAAANTTYTGFDLYASSRACGDAKLAVARKRAALARAKRALAAAESPERRRRLRTRIRRLKREIAASRSTVAARCEPPPA